MDSFYSIFKNKLLNKKTGGTQKLIDAQFIRTQERENFFVFMPKPEIN